MPLLRVLTTLLVGLLLSALACLLPATAVAKKDDARAATGGTDPADPRYAPGKKAKIVNGYAIAPEGAPPEVVAAIEAGNRIIRKPYKYGGGHARIEDSGYDCSGSVSYALHGADLLDISLDSTGFMSWGEEGVGQWVTIYSDPGHVWMEVAGLRFDTSGAKETGSRWQTKLRSGKGYAVTHPEGL